MPERREIRLHDDDRVAGAQILSWIAWPHRHEYGVALLDPHCAQSKKPGRIKLQLAQFRMKLLDGFVAGGWFDYKILAAAPDLAERSLFSKQKLTTRQLAKRWGIADGKELGNSIRSVWPKRMPVVHLASAARTILTVKCFIDEIALLPESLLDPSWVKETVDLAEMRLGEGVKLGAFEAAHFHRFHRDTF